MNTLPEVPPLLLVLKDACEKYGYEWRLVEQYSNSLVEVSDGNKSFFASNAKMGTYPINPRFAAGLAKDKAWSYEVLKQKGFRVVEGDYFFVREAYRELRGDGKELEDAYAYARQLGYPLFVKPNNSSLGILAELIYDEEHLKNHLEHIAQLGHIALIQKPIELPEYRIFAVDGKVQFSYRRLRTAITGDGASTIHELISELNTTVKREQNLITEESLFFKRKLEECNLTLDSVLEEGAQLQVASKSNISAGGKITEYTEQVSPATADWVRRLMETLGLRVTGIDVFVDGSIDDPENFQIIEINSSPSLVGIYKLGYQEKALEIWKGILEKYFE